MRIPFVANAGQTDEAVAYYASTLAGTVFVTKDGKIVYSLAGERPSGRGARLLDQTASTGWSLAESVVGGKAHPRGSDTASTKVSYFVGNEPARWRSGLTTFEAVSFGEVWPGISLELRAHGKNVEKLFKVEPGADPSQIRMRLAGARSLRVDAEGALRVGTDRGEVAFTPPVAFQERGGQRQPVTVAYVLNDDRYGFRLERYDPTLPLVIDPLLQATYLGGNGVDQAWALAIHPTSGDVYVTGRTESPNFPGTTGGAQAARGGGQFDAFIARLNAGLTVLEQATYLGGSGYDTPAALAIHPTSGDVYVAGTTGSTDFPGVTGGAQATHGGGSFDVFIARLNAGLTVLDQATYLGGSGDDSPGSLTIHPTSGDVYVAGSTGSTNFPGTAGGVQATFSGGQRDAFIARLDAGLTVLDQATYLGGICCHNHGIGAVAIHPTSGEVYVAGSTSSPNFPGTAGGAQPTYGGATSDGFVARFNAGLTVLGQATYLGGSGNDQAWALAIHPASGDVYVAGSTESTDLPHTSGGAQAAHGGFHDAFVARLNAGLTVLGQATYLGGSGDDIPSNEFGGLAIHPTSGDVYVAGPTTSTDFPGTAGGAQATHGGGPGQSDAFIARLNAGLTVLGQATYLGGANPDLAYALAIHPISGDVYVAGWTESPNFPGTTGGAQAANGGGPDGFVARLTADLALARATTTAVTSAPNPSGFGQSVTFTATVTATSAPVTEGTVTFKEGASILAGPTALNVSGKASFSTTTLSPGQHTITAEYGGTANFTASGGNVTQTVTATGAISGTVCANSGPPCAAGNPAISGATVIVRNPVTTGQIAITATDGSGNYNIGGLVPGSYKVSAQAGGFAVKFFDNQANLTSGNLVTVNAGATTANINFGLSGNAGSIMGRVTLLDGVTAVPSVNVAVTTMAGDLILRITTDANGNYNTQRVLTAGNYVVGAGAGAAAGLATTYYVSAKSIATATPVPVAGGSDTTGINIRLSSLVGGISGQVTSAAGGAPIAFAGVRVFDAASNGAVFVTSTDATGHYDTGQTLAAGQYKVTASIGGSETIAYNNKFSAATGDVVTVTVGATTSGIDIALPVLGGITGHVRDASTNAGIGGTNVLLFDYVSNAVLATTATATSGDIGSYTFSNLNPLQAYKLRTGASTSGNYGLVFFNNKPSAGTADVVTVPAGANATVDFALTAGAGGIIGSVVDAVTLAPIPGVTVNIVDGAATNFSINDFLNFGPTFDASGNFNTGRVLNAGVYKLVVRKFNSGYIQSFYGGGLDLSTAATITVTAGTDTPPIVVAMQPGGTITGTIRDRASNTPIAGANITVIRVGSSNFFGDFNVTSDANGNYTITGLHPGEWLVYAQASGHQFGWYSGNPNDLAPDFGTALPVQIAGTSTVSGVNFNLVTGGGEVRGRVTRNDNGQPVPVGTPVRLRGPWPLAGTPLNLSSLTNAQGDFSLPGMLPGRYFVEADRFQMAGGTAIGFYPLGSLSRTTGIPITIVDGGVLTTDFQVLGFAGSGTPRKISGTLKDPTNAPIRNAYVTVSEPTGQSTVRVVGALDDGSYVMDGLAPGRYIVNVFTETTFVAAVYPSELTRETGTLVDVTAGDAAGINFVVPNNAGTITGAITRSDNGQPILGAAIAIRTFAGASIPVGPESRVDGTYVARAIPPGAYKVAVSAPGFVTKYFSAISAAGVLTLQDGSLVDVTAGTNTPNINVALDPNAGALTGTVKRADTLAPMVAAIVAVYDASTGNHVLSAITDATGTWRTESVAAGSYVVVALDVQAARFATLWYSGQSTRASANPVAVTAGNTTSGIDFLVSPMQGSISGQVLGAGATPLAGVSVEILDSLTGGFVRRALTGSDGRYSAQGLEPGANFYVAHAVGLGFNDQYYAGVTLRASATKLTVLSGADTPNINFTLTPSSSADVAVTAFANPSPVLSGANLTYTITVSNAGPDPAVNVNLFDTVPAGTTFQSLTPSSGCSTPAVNGTGSVSCTLSNLASGASVIFALVAKVTTASGSVSNTASVSAATQDPNTANNSASVTTSITQPGAISGTVTQGAGGPSPGAAIVGATVILTGSNTGNTLATTTTDGSGNYTFGGLLPGNYKVYAQAGNFATRWFNNQLSFGAGSIVTVSAGATTGGINLALPGNAGGISGRVTLADGTTPVPNASVNIRTVPGSDFVLNVTTDASGNYDTGPRLGAGNYFIRATTGGLPSVYFDGAKSAATATPVVVNANATTSNINVRLSSGAGGISGRVTSAATGAPLASVNLSFFDASTGGFIQVATTDATGTYNTGQTLAPGQYKVTAGTGGSETIAYSNKFSVATGDPVTVTNGSTTTSIDLALPLLGGITGHVRNAADNGALAGATVQVFDYAANTFVTGTTTAADGSYTISNLNPLQAYRVRAFAPNFGNVFFNNKPSAGTADVVTIPAGSTTTLDFALAAAGGILGTVRDAATSLPIQGVNIDIVDGASTNLSINNFANFAVTTDVNGNFNTGRILAPGTYKLRARKVNNVGFGYIQTFYQAGFDLSTAAIVTVTTGVDTPNVNIAMTKGGTITGTIRDRASGQPISGASVAVQRVASSNFFVDNFPTTDVNGNYTVTGLHPGEWLVSVVATGHMLGWYSGDPNNLATDFGSSLPIKITGSNTVSNVNVNLPLGGGEVRGRITRTDNGQPVPPGTFVAIRGPWPRTNTPWNFAGGPSGGPAFTLLTNTQGDYAFTGLPPGRYLIEANRFQVPNGTAIGFFPTGAVSRGTAVPVTITDGGVATADFQVVGFSGNATPRAISGTLKDTSNNPIRNAFVFVYEPTATSFIRGVSVFDDGSFVADGLAPGRYLLNANAEQTFVSTNYPAELTLNTATVIDVTTGDVSGINLVLPSDAGTVTGTVTRSDNGQPVLGASVGVRTFFDSGVNGAVSRIDGTYLVRGVKPGFYKVRVSAPGFVTKFFDVSGPGGATTLENGSFVTVAAGANTPNINVVLDPTGGALTGTVKRQDTLQAVAGAVAVIHDATTGNRVTAVVTDASGTWRTEGLGTGTYKVGVFDIQDARFAGQWYSGKGTLLSADTVTVASVGTTGGIDFLVSPNRGSVSGRAFLSDGETLLADAVITLRDAATGGRVRTALTGSDGRYSAQGLAPGGNLYLAQTRALGFADQFYSGVASPTAGTPLTVANGVDTPNVNFNLTRTSDIAGTIGYGGTQTGALRVRLFRDAAFTQQVYETVIPSPRLGAGQSYSFSSPSPDTRGLLPGTYFIKAFVDSNGNGTQDPTEAVGRFGVPDSVIVAESAVAAGKSFSIADPPATTNTAPVADAQTVIFVQGSSNNSIILTGLDTQTATANLTYAVVSNPLHGTLTTTINPQQRLYTPNPGFSGNDVFTFTVTDRGDPDNCGAPGPGCSAALTSAPATVSIQVNPDAGTTSRAFSNPSVAGPSQNVALGNLVIDENTTGALQSGAVIRITVPPGLTFRQAPLVSLNVGNGAAVNPASLESPRAASFTLSAPSTSGPASILISSLSVDVASGFLADGVTSAAVLTTISGPNPGLTAASVQNATVVGAAAGPAITTVLPTKGAQGATGRIVVITGANFDTDASVSFGAGVTASVSVDSPSQITATLALSPVAALGARDVVVTSGLGTQSATKAGAFTVTGRPTLASVSGPLVHCDNQFVTIVGSNFQQPTTIPSDLSVAFSGTGIVVTDVGFTSQSTITALVSVDAAAANTAYDVTVVNPDGGSVTGTGIASVASDACQAAPPSKNVAPPPPPPAPSITTLSASSGPVGSSLLVNGANFSATPANNAVTFAGPNGARVPATVTLASTAQLTVTVPAQAITGSVTVAVSSVVSNAAAFTVTTPLLAGVVPGSITTNPSAVSQVPLSLTGSRFAQGASVVFGGPAGDVTAVGAPTVSPDGNSITLTVSVPPTPQLSGARDVTVINPGVCTAPALADCLSSKLTGGLVVQAPPAATFTISLPDFADQSTYLPSVGGVVMTRLASGACNPSTKVVTPAGVRLQAQFVSSSGLTPPTSVTFTLASSALPGTATNENCEVDPANPTKDFSAGLADVASQQVVVLDSGGGLYQTTLYSYDWGGKVTITVTGSTAGVNASASRAYPIDSDGDDLPDSYEANQSADQNNVNVLNPQNPDQNGNAVKDRDDRFARDGLTNFEKFRGVYLVGPAPNTAGAFSGFLRLGAGFRHMFVRGRGFRDDPAVPAGFCGINPATGAPVPDATLSPTNVCPAFQVGDAFRSIGVAVHNVSSSFTATTELPRVSLVNPLQATLDLALVIYDGANCKGAEPCDTTSKFGVRQWITSTLGYTTPNGTATTYGVSTVYKRAIECFFNCHPYEHRTNDPARVVAAPDGTPMLAPITRVGDSGTGVADNGLADSGEATINGVLAGDTYIPGSFNRQLTTLDVNNDGCIEQPTAADPTTLARCVPTADKADPPSATKQQVVRSIVTHEMGHLAGIAAHTNDPTDIMYLSTINYTRDDHFSSQAAGLVQIHNKGLQ